MLQSERRTDINAFIMFSDLSQLMHAITNLSLDEFRDVVRLHQTVVIARVLLRKEKGFGHVALIIHMSEEGTRIQSIKTAAAEDKPMAVAAPGVITFHVVAVGSRERIEISRLQMDHV